MMFPNTARDEFHRRPFMFDPGESPAVDEELLERERRPVIEDPEIAAPEEVTGHSGRPDPFRMHTRREQVSLSLLDEPAMRGDITFL